MPPFLTALEMEWLHWGAKEPAAASLQGAGGKPHFPTVCEINVLGFLCRESSWQRVYFMAATQGNFLWPNWRGCRCCPMALLAQQWAQHHFQLFLCYFHPYFQCSQRELLLPALSFPSTKPNEHRLPASALPAFTPA